MRFSRAFRLFMVCVICIAIIPYTILLIGILRGDTKSTPTKISQRSIEDLPAFYISTESFMCGGEVVGVPTLFELKKKLRDWKIHCTDVRYLDECSLPVADKEETWVNDRYHDKFHSHKLLMIVPVRNQPHVSRCRQLGYFIAYMKHYLKHRDFHIYVVELTEGVPFSRSYAMNIGSILAGGGKYDYYVFHDVDMVPYSTNNAYAYATIPIHRARYCDPGKWWNDLFGGITQVPVDVFHEAGGFSIGYWAWGGEDEDLRSRILYVMERRNEADKILRLTQDELQVKCFDHYRGHVRGDDDKRIHEEWRKNVVMKELTMEDPEKAMKGCGISQTKFRILDVQYLDKVSIYTAKITLDKDEAREICVRYFDSDTIAAKYNNEKLFKAHS